MDIKLLLIFVVLNILNVIIQTVKSICTINCGKTTAAVVNAIAYGLYTVVLVSMNCELPLWAKAVVVGLCNLIGVYIVKAMQEKTIKEKLWKVELTIEGKYTLSLSQELKNFNLPHNFIQNIGNKDYATFNIYCYTKKDSLFVKQLADRFNAKYFVAESKVL